MPPAMTATNAPPTRPPEPPNPRHAARVPAHIGKTQFNRIRQAAYTLPQVVKPGDYLDERSAGFEDHLDKLGLVLLQKAAAGARPCRWSALPRSKRSACRGAPACGRA